MVALPTDIDTTYPDSVDDPSVQLHQQYHDEIHQRLKGVVVQHGSDATMARPLGASVVHWHGTVQPNNLAVGDIYWDETTDLPSRWDGTVLHPAGSATYVAAHPVAAPTGVAATDTAAIQAALTAAAVAGGRVVLQPGVYSVSADLVLASGVSLEGAGTNVTTIALNGAARVVTNGFDALTGTNPVGSPGVSGFRLKDLKITGGGGVRLYGFDYDIDTIEVSGATSHGFWSEWSNAATAANSECRIAGLRTHDNGGDGFHFNGPHDSFASELLSYLNAAVGIYLGANADGFLGARCHSWGATQTHATQVFANGATLIGLQSEGATIDLLQIGAGDITVSASNLFVGAGNVDGITFVSGANRFRFKGAVNGFGTGAAVNFTNDNASDLDIVVTSGTAYRNTPSATTRARFNVPGTGVTTLIGTTVDTDGGWTSYAPVLTAVTTNPTLGVGSTALGWYKQIGKLVHVYGQFQFGASGAAAGSGKYHVSLPVPRIARTNGGPAGFAYDSSAFDFRVLAWESDGTTSQVALIAQAAAGAEVTDAFPWVWAANDQIRFGFTYEAA